ncbi:hypothetical protein RF11_13964 [Thelohanellus kitauei]|uniref:Uncharacterized protein n=1 Tax=Thelohanellus kitauei TaxID=669202 RepID=A0A0C2MH51_THEKT|nr:hypothetical protein RF11_13964 [Thelohanellus kitauei]
MGKYRIFLRIVIFLTTLFVNWKIKNPSLATKHKHFSEENRLISVNTSFRFCCIQTSSQRYNWAKGCEIHFLKSELSRALDFFKSPKNIKSCSAFLIGDDSIIPFLPNLKSFVVNSDTKVVWRIKEHSILDRESFLDMFVRRSSFDCLSDVNLCAKSTGRTIKQFPYKEFNFDPKNSKKLLESHSKKKVIPYFLSIPNQHISYVMFILQNINVH